MEPPIKPFAQPTPTLEARQQSLEIAPFELPLVEVYKNNIDVIEPRGLPIEFTPPIHAYSAPIQAPIVRVPAPIQAPPAPIAGIPAPIQAPPAPIVGVVASQYHAQDEFGNVAYGYSNPNSAKSEQRDSYGNVIGGYSYLDDTGYPKHVSYVADDFGFRITDANNFPIDPNNPV
jgi:hypothetical protein